MTLINALLILGATTQLIGTASYIKSMKNGGAKPNRATWLMWTVAAMIGAFSALANGSGIEVLPVFMAGFGPLLVLITSFIYKNAYWKLGKFDYFCAAASTIAIILWVYLGNPVIAYIFALIADFFGGVPTFIKTWKNPETEKATTYATGIFSGFISLFAQTDWRFTSYGLNLYIVLSNIFIVYLILFRKRKSETKR